jgi:hypothetical protein
MHARRGRHGGERLQHGARNSLEQAHAVQGQRTAQ